MKTRTALITAIVGFALAVAISWHGVARASAPNPSHNLPFNGGPVACTTTPLGAACEEGIVADLDSAHTDMGLPAYRLPANFVTLSAPEQLLILTDLDRRAYGLILISGLSPSLDHIAAVGADSGNDPVPTAAILHNPETIGGGGIYAGTFPNVLAAYYVWMYDDGWGGSENATSNEDCTSPTAALCWGHRDILLAAYPSGTTITMGASTGSQGYAGIVVATREKVWRLTYTWKQAKTAIASSSA